MIQNEDVKNEYIAAGQTTFAYSFRILDQTHLLVKVNSVTQTLGSDYSVTGVDSSTGGNVVFVSAPASGALVELSLNPPFTQLTSYEPNSKFPETTHELALDKLTQMALTLKSQVDDFSSQVTQSQRGTAEVASDSFSVDVTLATAFTTTNYAISVITQWNSNGWWISNKTTTGFTINWPVSPDSTSTVEWKADNLTFVQVTDGSLLLPTFSTSSIPFASGPSTLSQTDKLKWDSSNNRLIVGDAGVFNTSTRDTSMVFLQRSVTSDASNVLGWNLVSQMNVGSFTSTGPSWRAAILGQAVSSVVANGTAADITAVSGQAFLSGTTDGRATAMTAEAIHVAGTDDGLLIGLEATVINLGSVTTNEDDVKPKINLWLGTHQEAPYTGWQKITSAIAMTNTPGAWHFGWLMRHITSVFISMRLPAESGAIGIDMKNSANWGQSLVCPNAAPISFYNAAGNATRNVIDLTNTDTLAIGQDAGVALTAIFGGGDEGFRCDGTGIGFFGGGTAAKPTVTGSKGANAALASLLTALAGLGLLTDSSS